jgi:hypothetical protein
MKRLIALEAKQSEVARNHAMRALVSTPSHFGHGGEVGTIGRLVRKWVQPWIVIILIQQMFHVELYMYVGFCWWHVICRKMN